jgi:hypothetical protein
MTTNTPARRTQLKQFADTQLRYDRNRAFALVNIVRKAAELVSGMTSPEIAMIDDLEQVMIGTNMTDGRGKGGFFVGNFLGATGFKPELRDDYNQVQHATAGIVIGFRHGPPGMWLAMWLEDEPQDDLLYEATCPLGWYLAPFNYGQLWDELRKAICEKPDALIYPVAPPDDLNPNVA